MNKQTQQKVADLLHDLKDSYIVGIINDFEFAGKILAKLELIALLERSSELDAQYQAEHPFRAGEDPDDDAREISPMFDEEPSQTESNAYRGAH